MSAVVEAEPKVELCSLHSGDRLTRAQFHRLYEQTEDDFRAELIGGVVYVSSPLKLRHGTFHWRLLSLLARYEETTPGLQGADNTTTILGEYGEPQPDLFLRVLPEFGGQSTTTMDGYPMGPPELIVEIAHSSRAIDLHAKKDDYERAGVREYIVLCAEEREIRAFRHQEGRFVSMQPDTDGILRSHLFPGLWINVSAVLAHDSAAALATLRQGIATPEHAAFAERLRSRKKG